MKNEVAQMLDMILPALSDGLQKQKSDIFRFVIEKSAETLKYCFDSLEAEKLEQASLHNLSAEQSLGFINYELSQRGSRQLAAASASPTKSRSAALLERLLLDLSEHIPHLSGEVEESQKF